MSSNGQVIYENGSGEVWWDGGRPRWHAHGYMLMWGPRIVSVRMTKWGARFAAWRRRNGLVL